MVHTILSGLRLHLGEKLGLIPKEGPEAWNVLWVTEFPLFEYDEEENAESEAKGIGSVELPPRKIYCLDLRSFSDAEPYLDEVRRIAAEATMKTVDLMSGIQGDPKQEQLQRYLNPLPILNGQPGTNGSAINGNGQAANGSSTPTESNGDSAPPPEKITRRWYPVIDYSRCTNCMECIDFCLFGVYGHEESGGVRVALPRNCKDNCPACARICPAVAIVFPKSEEEPVNGAEVTPESVAAGRVQMQPEQLGRGDIVSFLRQRMVASREAQSPLRADVVAQALQERRRRLDAAENADDGTPGGDK